MEIKFDKIKLYSENYKSKNLYTLQNSVQKAV